MASDMASDMAVQVLAHQGASRAERANTVESFRRAGAMGADGVELDVRRTADGALVVHHDSRLADGRVICETEAAELPAYIPSLAAALDACEGMWVNLEIKNDESEPDFDTEEWVAGQTMAYLDRRGDPQRWLMSSFRIETIDRCRQLLPQVRTAWLVSIVPEDATGLLVSRGHAALHPWVELLGRDVVDRCHAAGLAVNTWTCDDPARMAELIAWGVDGICTNVPEVLLAVIAETAGAAGVE